MAVTAMSKPNSKPNLETNITSLKFTHFKISRGWEFTTYQN